MRLSTPSRWFSPSMPMVIRRAPRHCASSIITTSTATSTASICRMSGSRSNSSHSTLDEGQFGQALILSSFNYKRGEIYGGEFTTSYDHGPFSAYGNLGYEWARGTHWSSAQFLFDPDEYAFVKNHWIFLDHDQRFTGSAGASYTWNDWKITSDFLYGNGLRHAFVNSRKLPAYETVN